jgi:hypothetical protein
MIPLTNNLIDFRTDIFELFSQYMLSIYVLFYLF